jgi:hypothetical protein
MPRLCRIHVAALVQAIGYSPLDGRQWEHEPIDEAEVRERMRLPFDATPDPYDFGVEDRASHVTRIAWYALHGWGDKLVSVLVPMPSYTVTLYDGHHRLAAALVRGDSTMAAEVWGQDADVLCSGLLA